MKFYYIIFALFWFCPNLSVGAKIPFLADLVRCDDCPIGDTLNLTFPDGRKTNLPYRLNEINTIYNYKDKNILIGTGLSNLKIAFVISSDGEVLDAFYGGYISPSPSGRYLLYTKFYPRFAPPEVRSDELLIYDLQGDTAHNRMDNTVFSPGNLNANVGKILYPSVTRDAYYDTWVSVPSDRITILELGWSDQSDVGYAIFKESESFVFIILYEKGSQIKVNRLFFEEAEVIPKEVLKNNTMNKLIDSFYPGKVRFYENSFEVNAEYTELQYRLRFTLPQ